ncbi:Y-family DNA polymerase [Paracoccus sediminicola]|uniref:Y-family DNA polymerase n=1 Tax=Paracoccus sediminicola TaxID=3017783 RepID=UPI0022F12805|nr:DNA polymerase Y family protein [Paracoccus sediminicola]WBU55770.1 DNA polymerase Y family protein [Paracoccus sediminicola]
MFGGANRRVVSLWFPRLPSDRVLRARPVEGPFALTLQQDNTNRIFCLNAEAEARGLYRSMGFSDARAFCPELQSRSADQIADQEFLTRIRRWATRYCPWVGLEGRDGLVMDITGSAHLAGGEEMLRDDLRDRLSRIGLAVRIGIADTRGAAWALARHGEGVARPGHALDKIGPLSVAALRLDSGTVTSLQRLGLNSIRQLAEAPRAPLARRFGPGLMMRLDQATGAQPEQVSPQSDPPHYGVRMSLPEPIGLTSDVMEGTNRLLIRLCDKLKQQQTGARVLCLTLRRVDQQALHLTLRLARPLREPARILSLFARDVADLDAGYGIDQLRLEATQVEALASEQISHVGSDRRDRIDDLITRIGTRIGLENVQRFLPADSHVPERSFTLAPAAYTSPAGAWVRTRPRPLVMFPPESISASGASPPHKFRWRRMSFTTMRTTGPERIMPEWWRQDEGWSNGIRDYWRIETREGRRLWMFYTPQNPGWFVQGEFA